MLASEAKLTGRVKIMFSQVLTELLMDDTLKQLGDYREQRDRSIVGGLTGVTTFVDGSDVGDFHVRWQLAFGQ